MPVFCASLTHALTSAGFEVGGWTTDELEAVRLAESVQPDAVLTEIDLDTGSGMSLARRLRDRGRVVVLTRVDVGEVLLDAVEAGAVGCIGHGLDVPTLATCLQELARHAPDGRFIHRPDELLPALRRATAIRTLPAGARIGTLTPREREVIRLLADGLDDDAIARTLYLSRNTVRTHIGKALRRLGVHSRADATRIFLAAGAPAASDPVTSISGPSLEPR